MKTALITGSSGFVGKIVLQLLLNDSNYGSVVSLVRRSSGIVHPKLREVVVDFDQLHLYKTELKAEVAICCLGSTMKKAGSKAAFEKVDLNYPLHFAHLFRENGGTQFTIISAMGADESSLFYYNQVKGRVERELMQLHFPILNIVRPSLLMGNREEQRNGEGFAQVLFKALGWLMQGPLKKYRGIAGSTVAAAIIRIQENNLPGINIYNSAELQQIGQ